ncbi:ferredoxin [Streptomyces sp. NPDC015346]|uniref:ferredoxin n=1 Tax=Streptomyces sp. NPDC015346 TaxID=3364954 RepID=UPI0036FFBE1E
MSADRPDGEFRPQVDRSRCVGSRMCAEAAPEAFEVDGEGRARPRLDVSHLSQVLIKAAALCPVEAIAVFEARSGRQIAPAD